MEYEGHDPIEIDGWTQVGHVDGYKFGCWVKQLPDGRSLSIQLGDESKRYWLRIGNAYHGGLKTPQAAAKRAANVLARED